MATKEELWQAPSVEALTRLAERLAPGSRVLRVRRLTGGMSAGMHALTLERAAVDALDLTDASGRRLRVVLRRAAEYEYAREGPEERIRRMWDALVLVERLGLPAPRPLLLDADGELCGAPALVMSRLPGRAVLRPRDPAAWAAAIGRVIALLHGADLSQVEPDLLPSTLEWVERWLGPERPPGWAEVIPEGEAALAVLRAWWPRLEPVPAVLTHGDPWPGNIVWLGGQVSGVVDWAGAARGPAGLGLAICRVDTALLAGQATADAVLHAYEAATGRRIPRMFFWDLYAAALALPDPARWVMPAYHGLGRTDMTAEIARARLRTFMQDALRRAAVADGEAT